MCMYVHSFVSTLKSATCACIPCIHVSQCVGLMHIAHKCSDYLLSLPSFRLSQFCSLRPSGPAGVHAPSEVGYRWERAVQPPLTSTKAELTTGRPLTQTHRQTDRQADTFTHSCAAVLPSRLYSRDRLCVGMYERP
mmetsp:Transcript_23734/g.68272  ORF Transcript_23734/g.68272 Transcript_23734/m.68272 type:complete len:136 (+) Transcript_23734:544-951(+)